MANYSLYFIFIHFGGFFKEKISVDARAIQDPLLSTIKSSQPRI